MSRQICLAGNLGFLVGLLAALWVPSLSAEGDLHSHPFPAVAGRRQLALCSLRNGEGRGAKFRVEATFRLKSGGLRRSNKRSGGPAESLLFERMRRACRRTDPAAVGTISGQEICSTVDIDQDGIVGPKDLGVFSRSGAVFELDGNGVIGKGDLLTLQGCWGAGLLNIPTPVASVPPTPLTATPTSIPDPTATSSTGPTATPSPVSTPGLCTAVSQNEITWYFYQAVPCGRFVSGDWWVLGPVTISSVSPSPSGSGVSYRHGSVLNPAVSPLQAFDGRANGFSEEQVVAFPTTINGAQSLVSSRSHISGTHLTYLSDMAVLTVLDSLPPANAFRPAFVGTTKTIYAAASLPVLPSLPAVLGVPEISAVIEHNSKPWPWFMNSWQNYEIFPESNMAYYGRDIANETSIAAALLLLDESVVGDKGALYRGMVQIGIDLYAMVSSGARWPADGGNHGATKFPIVFAGWALNVQSFRDIANSYPPSSNTFAEDTQVFFVSQKDVERTLDVEVSFSVTGANGTMAWGPLNRALDGYAVLGVGTEVEVVSGLGRAQRRRVTASNQVRGSTLEVGSILSITMDPPWDIVPASSSIIQVLGYEPSDIGLAEWGIQHHTNPRADNPAWGADYRQCCTAKSWTGTLLAAQVLGLDDFWNNHAAFAYQDRYVRETGPSGDYPGWGPEAFQRNMWEAIN